MFWSGLKISRLYLFTTFLSIPFLIHISWCSFKTTIPHPTEANSDRMISYVVNYVTLLHYPKERCYTCMTVSSPNRHEIPIESSSKWPLVSHALSQTVHGGDLGFASLRPFWLRGEKWKKHIQHCILMNEYWYFFLVATHPNWFSGGYKWCYATSHASYHTTATHEIRKQTQWTKIKFHTSTKNSTYIGILYKAVMMRGHMTTWWQRAAQPANLGRTCNCKTLQPLV